MAAKHQMVQKSTLDAVVRELKVAKADLAHAMGVIDTREGEVEELQDESFEARDRIEHLEAALAGAEQTRAALTGVLTMVWGQMVERERQ